MADIWDYFVDGKQGIQKRFVAAIRERVQQLSSFDADEAAEPLGVEAEVLRSLVDSSTDISEVADLVTPEIIETLSAALVLDTRKCFGIADLSQGALDDLTRRANGDKFVVCAAAGDARCPENDRLALYLIMQALDAFEENAASVG